MIKCAAICINATTQFPIIVSGPSHAHCYEVADCLGVMRQAMTGVTVEGFLNDANQFLDRYDAMYEALRCNQLTKPSSDRALHSYDIF